MKGNNTLLFNQATMMKIVQEWIDNNIKGSHSVTGIRQQADASGQFEIKTESDDIPDCEEPQKAC